jgi:hypothetical protein
MRELKRHHDGYGLNDLIDIEADDKDPDAGNASHSYVFSMPSEEFPENIRPKTARHAVASVRFQHGPRNAEGSLPGVTEAAILAMLIDRITSFQNGPYPCTENARMLEHLEGALKATKERATNRANRGVLGTNTK